MSLFWQIMYVLITVICVAILPFAIFYYEVCGSLLNAPIPVGADEGNKWDIIRSRLLEGWLGDFDGRLVLDRCTLTLTYAFLMPRMTTA